MWPNPKSTIGVCRFGMSAAFCVVSVSVLVLILFLPIQIIIILIIKRG